MRPGQRLLRRAILILALLAPAAAFAQTAVVSEKPDSVAIVVYPMAVGRYAMVSETRTVDLPAGPVTIRFAGVSETMVPQSAALGGLSFGAIEQNFDFDVLTPGSLVDRSIGRAVTVVRVNPATGLTTRDRAVLRSGPAGPVLDFGGSVEPLGCGGQLQGLVFDDLPPGFQARPTLSVRVVSPRPGRYKLSLRYIATNISWTGNYVARIRPDGQSLDIAASVTVMNGADTAFRDAAVQVLAGGVLWQPEDTRAPALNLIRTTPGCWTFNSGRRVRGPVSVEDSADPIDVYSRQDIQDLGSPTVTELMRGISEIGAVMREGDLGDLKLYTLPFATTLAPNQSKELALFRRSAVRFTRVYRLVLGVPAENQHVVGIVARLWNKPGEGLGLAMPGGNVVVMEPTAGGTNLLGEYRIQDTPVGLPVELLLGPAMGVTAGSRVVRDWTVGSGPRRRRRVRIMAYFVNEKPTPVLAEIQQNLDFAGSRIQSESLKHSLLNGLPTWSARLAPGERLTVTYTLEWSEPAPPRSASRGNA